MLDPFLFSCASDMIAWPTELQHQLGEKGREKEMGERVREGERGPAIMKFSLK